MRVQEAQENTAFYCYSWLRQIREPYFSCTLLVCLRILRKQAVQGRSVLFTPLLFSLDSYLALQILEGLSVLLP
jgi:hypothetical protein